MNRISILRILFFLPLFSCDLMAAQEIRVGQNWLTLDEAVRLSKENNKTVGIARDELLAAEAEYLDTENGKFPAVTFNSAYQRFSDVTFYDHGFNSSSTISKRPDSNGANVGIEGVFNVYSGGRQRAVIAESALKKEVAAITLQEQAGNIGLQVATQYLDLVRLHRLKGLIAEQRKRAELRLKNITAFYENQRITKNDLLRAKVILSNILLSQTQNDNDIKISSQKLALLINTSEQQLIIPADSIMGLDNLKIPSVGQIKNPYPLQKLEMGLKIQSARRKFTMAGYIPSLQFVSAYGFNYPNNLFSVPVAQTYAVGFVGVRLSYNISSVYQNRYKVKAIELRTSALEQQKKWVSENIQQETEALEIKYNEALQRVQVNELSIQQAKANLDITNNKYLNQLALLTDLLDADNLYQETRYSYVSAQTNAMVIYYRLLFIQGLL